jgi:hypothetical protein
VVDHLVELMEHVGGLGVVGVRPSFRPKRGGEVILGQPGQYAAPPIIGLVQRNKGTIGGKPWGTSQDASPVTCPQ